MGSHYIYCREGITKNWCDCCGLEFYKPAHYVYRVRIVWQSHSGVGQHRLSSHWPGTLGWPSLLAGP